MMTTDTQRPKPLTADEEAEFRRWSEATPYNDCRSMELGRKALATLDELRAERDEARAQAKQAEQRAALACENPCEDCGPCCQAQRDAKAEKGGE